MKLNGDFIMSTELECLTSVQSKALPPEVVVPRFLEVMSSLAPSLPGPSGFFNAYGRVYIDCNRHVELAACECASPYDLPSIVERQQILAARAVQQLEAEGHRLLLANNNHSGLLTADAPTWGAHENYLTEQHPTKFGQLILPFLVTRIYGGAGGIQFPSGDFLAAVRPVRIDMAAGGGTTSMRAIHSTARDEHHMGPAPSRFRYHLILGDGHASHFNLALQVGATALALKAIFFDRKLKNELQKFESITNESCVPLLKRLNVLAAAGQPPRVDSFVFEVQRMYLAGAQRYAESLSERPIWISRLLHDWDQTLGALERMDLDWLSARLDAFAKHRLYSAVLAEQGKTWTDLARHRSLFHELALLDHSYHSFCDSQSVFRRLESLGLLSHRVSDPVEPGAEDEPFVPSVKTRADARARFIVQRSSSRDHMLDWSYAASFRTDQVMLLCDPFSQAFEAPATCAKLVSRPGALRMLMRHALGTF